MEEELRKKPEQDEEQGEYGSEERGATLREGRVGWRRGETARQLIRRAKQASRRRFPAEEKIRIVMEGIRAEVSVAVWIRKGDLYTMPSLAPKNGLL